ncbi:MAG: glycosyltransferase [Deltaproteobacteria bacterium]|nr:glycosyltransferase [Deltaproteobacteria bacterium]
MKILHVETGMHLYGGALQVYHLLDGLKHKGEIENILVCPTGSRIGIEAKSVADRVYTVSMRGDLDLPFILRLTRIIHQERPDIVHLHSRRGADILGGIAAKLTGTRCILTRRVDNPEHRLIAGLKYGLYNHIIAISNGIKAVLVSEGVPTEKISCVRSAVDVEKYSQPGDRKWFLKEFGLPGDARTCAVVAQLIERKGHRYLIEAIPEILRNCSEAYFLFLGKGPMEAELKLLCGKSGILDHVIFAGFRDDPERVIPCLDLLVHPALMEGLGVSLLQAAAAGVPIVGTRVGGIPEVVRDGMNGYLIEPGSTGAITDAVVRLLARPDSARAMGLAGKKMVRESFSIEEMVEGNLRVYLNMQKNRSKG